MDVSYIANEAILQTLDPSQTNINRSVNDSHENDGRMKEVLQQLCYSRNVLADISDTVFLINVDY